MVTVLELNRLPESIFLYLSLPMWDVIFLQLEEHYIPVEFSAVKDTISIKVCCTQSYKTE